MGGRTQSPTRQTDPARTVKNSELKVQKQALLPQAAEGFPSQLTTDHSQLLSQCRKRQTNPKQNS
jgi:hypothetical protein